LSNVVAIAAGKHHSVAVRNDGQVFAWGGNSQGQTNVPAALTNVATIYAGGSVDFSNSRYRSYSLAILIGCQINSIELTGQYPTIRFHTFAGKQYAIEYLTELGSGGWLDLPDGTVSGNGYESLITDTNSPSAASQRFYRLRQF
jgi:hypothetical protein